nr:hypothetical protein [Ktedonobacteraceae bacterium]MBA3915325.1 hypothetical protein [Terriglobales bacterium]
MSVEKHNPSAALHTPIVGVAHHPKLAQLGPSIAMLRMFSVPATRIAEVFGATAGRVRQIHRRDRLHDETLISVPNLPELFDPEELAWIESASKRVRVPMHGRERREFEKRECLAEQGFSECAHSYQYSEGRRRMTGLLQFFPSVARMPKLRLKARILHYLAWFSVHDGYCASAFEHSLESMRLSSIAYRRSPGKLDLLRLSETALIAANASLLMHDPGRALKFLNHADQARSAAGLPGRGSELL